MRSTASGLLREELVGSVLHAGRKPTYLASVALTTAASPMVGAHIWSGVATSHCDPLRRPPQRSGTPSHSLCHAHCLRSRMHVSTIGGTAVGVAGAAAGDAIPARDM